MEENTYSQKSWGLLYEPLALLYEIMNPTRFADIRLQALHLIFSWLPRKKPVFLHPEILQIMNYMKYLALLFLPLMFGCSSNSGSESESENDSAAAQVDTLSADSPMDDYDWTPKDFQTEHPDEWVVVTSAINIQQRKGKINFGEIDSLVKDYLGNKKISLPSEVDKRIELIADVCKTRFDISGYDESNMGMCMASTAQRLFESYITWLYEKEATKVLRHNRVVDMEREMKLYERLNDAMYDVCDSVASCMGGSGGWVGSAQIDDLSIDFRKSMCQAIIGAKLEEKKELDVPLDLFDKECKALNDNYEPFEEDQPKDVSRIVKRFKDAFHAWYAYRKSTAARIKNKGIKKAYESVTYSFARIHFLHLKNRFSDIGLMSNSMYEFCLNENCTNNELLEFNYEEKWKESFDD